MFTHKDEWSKIDNLHQKKMETYNRHKENVTQELNQRTELENMLEILKLKVSRK